MHYFYNLKKVSFKVTEIGITSLIQKMLTVTLKLSNLLHDLSKTGEKMILKTGSLPTSGPITSSTKRKGSL